ncbi:hypothetical protein BB561_002422 [Smittium simulii]|uniref:Small EDRK-rich factor-like N-terminal domain-containing protein n=1 Tax=Smittium simulii TaxID=133385 RepID=A0A2T9YQG5_9FUNG|nr:hypothetical protein BB561_002422 [Smittium simulii]
MTRGNQREISREKAKKKLDKLGKGSKSKEDDGLSLRNKQERDAEIMRLKQKKKQELAEAASK